MPVRKRGKDQRPKPGDRKPYPAPFPIGYLVKYNGRALWGEKIRYGSVGKVISNQDGWQSPMEIHDGFSIVEFPDGRAAVDQTSANRVFELVGREAEK